jgi:hypothetical protein
VFTIAFVLCFSYSGETACQAGEMREQKFRDVAHCVAVAEQTLEPPKGWLAKLPRGAAWRFEHIHCYRAENS